MVQHEGRSHMYSVNIIKLLTLRIIRSNFVVATRC
jgi:hypothetical protein